MSFGMPQSAPMQPDPELVDPPTDSVSCMAFSPAPGSNLLAVGSWSSEVRLYDVNPAGVENRAAGPASVAKALTKHEAPVLDLCWTPDGSKVISGGADKAGRMYDLATGQSTQVAAHDAPIKGVRYAQSSGFQGLVTCGWDKKVKFWDLRSPNPVGALELQQRCFTMDTSGDSLVVGCAERLIYLIDLRNPGALPQPIESPLKYQTRVISCFPPCLGAPGFAVGSIEGRISYYVRDPVTGGQDAQKTFSFKCHRLDFPQAPGANALAKNELAKKEVRVYPVNAISFHQQYGTFCSAGGDGNIHMWDAVNRTRLKTLYPKAPVTPSTADKQAVYQTKLRAWTDMDYAYPPIVASAFNSAHNVLAFAQSYDWSKGHERNRPDMQAATKVVLHFIAPDEVKPKSNK